MDFSPYSPSPDEDRNLRIPNKKTKQQSKQPVYKSYQSGDPDSYAEQGLLNNDFGAESSINHNSSLPVFNGNQDVRVNKYETSLPIRVDIEAALAYVLGPITGLLLLILERQNDYVRFHAWQSSLTFSALMLAQFVLLFISTFLSWILFFFSIFLLIWLTYRAYLDGVSLERYEVPYFGIIASEYVDTE
ncbi:uncharacterized protein BX663DRAFT_524980 [Cokeromyces recurvatus]|uniref:uncharacterized protein n=1 Tax=Cokeromyces recurvatus TaxID=90255 RepID=UPI00221FE31E|nr:uncharacterized protein BX663DRAFT_524980 [Cokeromyces recurvatus]KAI7898498.1 hypothetical protein BX663DRAFT_524980 [Cokeromyces recurvatus]